MTEETPPNSLWRIETTKTAGALRRNGVLVLALVAVAVVPYLGTLRYGFVYDDESYVTRNSALQGKTGENRLVWSFTAYASSNWHPLTWLSHVLDYELFGLKPAGHHATNLLLHAANTVLLFALLLTLTGRRLRSAAVAALFAVHPLNVESVAWVAERKNLLSLFFSWLAFAAHAAFVRNARSPRPLERSGSRRFYWATFGALALALLSKPMAVTVPCVLLLLDLWPLNRVRLDVDSLRRALPALLREKVPFFLLAAGSSWITVQAQMAGESLVEVLPLSIRLTNAGVSYIAYLAKTLWPAPLVVFYPHPVDGLSPDRIAISLSVLGALTGLALWWKKQRPYVAMGWFWYLGTLVPVIGLVQVGSQSMADRYAYFPLVGIFIALVWTLSDWAGSARVRRMTLGAATAVALPTLMAVTAFQTRHWRDAITLFTHALEHTEDNFIAHNNVGAALVDQGKWAEAIDHLQRAVALYPPFSQAHNNLALALLEEGRLEEAEAAARKALETAGGGTGASLTLGRVQMARGRIEEAVGLFSGVLEKEPYNATARLNLSLALSKGGRSSEALAEIARARERGNASARQYEAVGQELLKDGKVDEAEASFVRALEVDPRSYDAHNALGAVLGRKGRFEDAASHFRKALDIQPESAQAQRNLGIAMMQLARWDEASSHLLRAAKLDPGLADSDGLQNAIGVALLNGGKVEESLTHFARALEINPASEQARANRERALALQRAGRR